jgi:hypothetical protein
MAIDDEPDCSDDEQHTDHDDTDGGGKTHLRFLSAQKALPRNGNMRPKYITHTQLAMADAAIALFPHDAS